MVVKSTVVKNPVVKSTTPFFVVRVLHGRHSHRKTAPTGRHSHRKTTSLEDNLTGRQLYRNTTSQVTTSKEYDVKGNKHENTLQFSTCRASIGTV